VNSYDRETKKYILKRDDKDVNSTSEVKMNYSE